ncbi:MAG: mediator of RNA polymerase II transcription subunit 8 [Peltula sp. TS41687]|nr:MAG: mediator of RNA polymerase II transcription subunit 8 [Peltula sp. TS41687]
MASLTSADIRALEQTRQRLFQLTNSLGSLQHNLHTNDPLPSWTSLQSLATIISQNLLSISQHLNSHHDLFSSIGVYPLPEFPGRTQENLLGQLLRKKLEPNVEDWVDQGRKTATELREGRKGLTEQGLVELWDWAGRAANEEARSREWADDFTLEERRMGVENVTTGLRRRLDRDDDEESDEEAWEKETGGSSEMDVDQTSDSAGSEVNPIQPNRPPLPMDDILRFLSIGVEPKNMVDGRLG